MDQSMSLKKKQQDGQFSNHETFSEAIHPIELFERIVTMHSSEPALTFFFESPEAKHPWRKESYTYSQLNQLSSQLAAYLRNVLALQPGEAVGLYFRAGPEYAIWLLALWRAGLVYLPFAVRDNTSHDDTLQHIADNLALVKSHYLVTNLKNEFSPAWEKIHQIKVIDHHVIIQEKSSAPVPVLDVGNFSATAYTICSSGTSGRPKMIAIPYEGIVEKIQCHITRMQLQQHEPVLAILSFEFDASLVEILMALLNGSNLVIAPADVRQKQLSLGAFFECCQLHLNCGPATAVFLPSHIRQFSPYAKYFKGLKRFITTGEAFDEKIMQAWHKLGIVIYNGYGPSEVTFGSSLTRIILGEAAAISHVMDSVRMLYYKAEDTIEHKFEKDEYEIFITGSGIGHYIGSDELEKKYFLTANNKIFDDKFRAENNLRGDERVYRTFDIVKKIDNTVFFVCRVDRVLKRNGHQIFLDKVEKIIQNQLGILAKKIIATPIENKRGAFAIFIEGQAEPHPSYIKDKVVSIATLGIPGLKNEMPNEWHLLKPNAELNTSNRKTNKKYAALVSQAEQLVCLMTDASELTETELEVANIWLSLSDNNNGNQYPQPFCQFEALGADSLSKLFMLHEIWNACEKVHYNPHPLQNTLYQYFEKNMVLSKLANFIDIYRKIKLNFYPSENLANPQVFIISNNKELEKLNVDFPVYFFNLSSKVFTDKHPEMLTHAVSAKIHTLCDKTNYHILIDNKIINQEFLNAIHCGRATILDGNILNIDEIKTDILLKNEARLQVTLKENLLKWQQQHLRNSPVADKIYTSQRLVYKELNSFIIESTKKIAFLLGEVGSGKSSLCAELLQESIPYQIIYLDLKSYKKARGIGDLLKEKGFSQRHLTLLKNQKVLFILEDYELIEQMDCPNLWNNENFDEWDDVKLLITCRKWYMADPLCWSNWQNLDIEKIVLTYPVEAELEKEANFQFINEQLGFVSPLHLSLIHQFRLGSNHENLNEVLLKQLFEYEKRRSGRNISLQDMRYTLERIAIQKERAVLLDLPPLRWQSGRPYFNMPITRQDEDFGVVAGLMKPEGRVMTLNFAWCSWMEQKKPALPCRLENKAKSEYSSDALYILQKGRDGLKPIFAFAPLTGDLPKIYRELAKDPMQPFYCFLVTEDDRKKKSADISKRIHTYVNIITSRFPNPKDPRQELILVGYSFGFIQAYHAAIELIAKGYTIAALVNLDCMSPQDILNYQQNHLLYNSLFSSIIDIYGRSNYFSEKIEKLLKSKLYEVVLEKVCEIDTYINVFRKVIDENSSDEISSQKFINILISCSINWKIILNSKLILNKIDIPITSFIATKKIIDFNEEAKYEWDSYCKNHIKIQVDGNHFNFFTDKHFIVEFYNLIDRVKIPSFSETLQKRINDYLEAQLFRFPNYLRGFQESDAKNNSDSTEGSVSKWVKQFINNDTNNLVILGQPGAGKSTAMQQCFREAVDTYQYSNKLFQWLPIYICLAEYKTLHLPTLLTSLKMSTSEFDFTKTGFVLFLDGYDEMINPPSIADFLHVEIKDIKIKIIVSCRDYFYFKNKSSHFNSAHEAITLKEWDNDKKVSYFEEHGISYENNWLLNDHSIAAWLKTPLLFYMATKIFSQLEDKDWQYKSMPRIFLNNNRHNGNRTCKNIERYGLYAMFISKTLHEHVQSLKKEGLLAPNLSDKKVIKAFKNYLSRLATDAFLQINGENAHDCFRIYQSSYIDTKIMQRQILASWNNGKPEFLHFTFVEYFLVKQLIADLLEYSYSFNPGLLHIMTNVCLRTKNNLLELFRENYSHRFKIRNIIKQTLFDIISQSSYFHDQDHIGSQDKLMRSIAAGNAITLLNTLGISFSKFDFSNTCINSADFSNSILSQTKFNNTKLINCDFSYSVLDATEFENTIYENCEFRELPAIDLKTKSGEDNHKLSRNSHIWQKFGWKKDVLYFYYLENRKLWLTVSMHYSTGEKYPYTDSMPKLTVSLWNLDNIELYSLTHSVEVNANIKNFFCNGYEIDQITIPEESYCDNFSSIGNYLFTGIQYKNYGDFITYNYQIIYDEIREELSISDFYKEKDDLSFSESDLKENAIVTYVISGNALERKTEYVKREDEMFLLTSNNLILFRHNTDNYTDINIYSRGNSKLIRRVAEEWQVRDYKYNSKKNEVLIITTDHEKPLLILNLNKNTLTSILCSDIYADEIYNGEIIGVDENFEKIVFFYEEFYLKNNIHSFDLNLYIVNIIERNGGREVFSITQSQSDEKFIGDVNSYIPSQVNFYQKDEERHIMSILYKDRYKTGDDLICHFSLIKKNNLFLSTCFGSQVISPVYFQNKNEIDTLAKLYRLSHNGVQLLVKTNHENENTAQYALNPDDNAKISLQFQYYAREENYLEKYYAGLFELRGDQYQNLYGNVQFDLRQFLNFSSISSTVRLKDSELEKINKNGGYSKLLEINNQHQILVATFYLVDGTFDPSHHFLRMKTWQYDTRSKLIEIKNDICIKTDSYDGVGKINFSEYVFLYNKKVFLSFMNRKLYNINAREEVPLGECQLGRNIITYDNTYLIQGSHEKNYIVHIQTENRSEPSYDDDNIPIVLIRKGQPAESFNLHKISIYYIKHHKCSPSIEKLVRVFNTDFIGRRSEIIEWDDAKKILHIAAEDHMNLFYLSFYHTSKDEYFPTLTYCNSDSFNRRKMSIFQSNGGDLTRKLLDIKNIAHKKSFTKIEHPKIIITPPADLGFYEIAPKDPFFTFFDPPNEVWHKIIGDPCLSYYDKRALACVCKELRLICNESEFRLSKGPLLTSATIEQAKIILLRYYGQMKVNTMQMPLSEHINDIEIKPDHQQANMLKISVRTGFFARKAERETYHLPVPVLMDMLKRN